MISSRGSRAFLSDAVNALKEGGEVDRLRVSPLPESYRTEEQRFSKAWDEISPSVKALIEQQDVLVRFDGLVNEVAALERELSASQRAARANIRDGAGNAPRPAAVLASEREDAHHCGRDHPHARQQPV